MKAIIWDLDGTLLNTLEDLRDAVNAALMACGHPQRSTEEIRQFVGNGVRQLMLQSVPAGTPTGEAERCLAWFKDYYGKHDRDRTAPYEGIPELLRELRRRGCAMAVVSNKYDGAVKELISHYFGELLPVAIGEREGVARKPAPDTVRLALRELGVSPSDAVYVGDSEVDIETAKNAGLPCISVTWGFREEAQLRDKGARQIACSPAELLKLLSKDD